MSISVISIIKQKNLAIFPLLEDTDLLGSMRVVANATQLTAIPASYRKAGMLVWQVDVGKLWVLNNDLVTWTEFAGPSGVDTLTVVGAVTAGMPLALNASGNLVQASAEVGGYQEVYGLARATGPGSGPIEVITSGICDYAPGSLSPGVPIWLDTTAGGVTQVAPSVSVAGRRIVSLGVARTSSTVLVRIRNVVQT